MASAVFDSDEEAVKQYNRLRRDVGASEAVLSNDTVEEYFVEASELFPNSSAKMKAQARVIALKEIRGNAIYLTKYAQGQSEEDLSVVFDRLDKLLDEAKSDVESAVDVVTAETANPFFFGTARGRRGQ
jgi:hypothetical protein